MSELSVEQRDFEWGQVADWFREHVPTLDMILPHEIEDTDRWAVMDSDGTLVGVAVVEPSQLSEANYDDDERVAWVHRIGVDETRRGEGFGRVLLERIHDEYGAVELEVDAEKPANGFYESIGMELVSEKYAVLNDGSEGTMNVWRWE